MLRELAVEFRKIEWRFADWQPPPALVDRNGGAMSRYQGQSYDPTRFDLVDDAWDHDHCEFCWATVSSEPSWGGFSSAYTDTEGCWICPICFERIIQAGEVDFRLLRAENPLKEEGVHVLRSRFPPWSL